MEKTNVVGAFSEEHAAKLAGLSMGQLRAWHRTQFFVPSIDHGGSSLPFGRIYSFRDVVSLRVLGQLRNTLKVPMQHLRKVAEELSRFGNDKWTATTLYVLGKRVVFNDPQTKLRREVVSGQRVLDIPLRVAIADTRHAILNLNRREAAERGEVVRHRFVQQNEPVFAGTRIPLSAVVSYLEAGCDDATILGEYPDLTAADIEAARRTQNGLNAA